MGNARVSTLRVVATALFFAANFVHHQIHLESQGIVTGGTHAPNYQHRRTDPDDIIMYGSHSRSLQAFSENDRVFCRYDKEEGKPDIMGTVLKSKPGTSNTKIVFEFIDNGKKQETILKRKCKIINNKDQVFCTVYDKSDVIQDTVIGEMQGSDGTNVEVAPQKGGDNMFFEPRQCEPYGFIRIKDENVIMCKYLKKAGIKDEREVLWQVLSWDEHTIEAHKYDD